MSFQQPKDLMLLFEKSAWVALQKAAQLLIGTGPCVPDVCVFIKIIISDQFKRFFQFLSNQTLDSGGPHSRWRGVESEGVALDSNQCCSGSLQVDRKRQDAAVVAAARLPASCGGLQQNRGPGHHIQRETQPWWVQTMWTPVSLY